jgi:hypothetical protein
MSRPIVRAPLLAITLTIAACGGGSSTSNPPLAKDPATAAKVSVDRFSDRAATLMRRSATPSLPAANQTIAFDVGAPFITAGLGPRGEHVRYYNFDVQPTAPAPIYAFLRAGGIPVDGQLNIVDVVPGDPGYNDFWQVHKVTVPSSYVPNSVTSLAELTAAGFPIEPTQALVNCPVVPDGSVATLRFAGETSSLQSGWYKGMVVKYFSFDEKALSGATVTVAPILVAFNVNPDKPGGGPGSGFVTEPGSPQTHNVVTALPADVGYSPLWSVDVYDNSAFATVTDLATVQAAPQLGNGVASVNCPIVEVK